MATEHYIAPEEIGIPAEDLLQMLEEEGTVEHLAHLLTEYFVNWHPEMVTQLKRGDTIALIPQGDRYRNDGVLIWNGSAVEPLDYSIDMYGAVPAEFKITDNEFSPHYWDRVICHNGIIWVADEILERAVFSVQCGPDGDVEARASLYIDTLCWTAVVDCPEDWDEEREDGLEPGSAAAFKADLLTAKMLCHSTPIEHEKLRGHKAFYLVRRYDNREVDSYESESVGSE